MWEAISQQYKKWTWNHVCSNIRTVGSKNIQPSHVESKGQNVSNIIGSIKQNTTVTSPGIARWTSRQTSQDWKQSKTNLILIHSDAWTAKKIIKQIQILVLFENINLIKSGTWTNTKNSEKVG